MQRVLEASGCTLADVAKTTAHLRYIAQFHQYNAVNANFFRESDPARGQYSQYR